MLASLESSLPKQAIAKPVHKGVHYIADKFRLFWRKAGHKFSHPLGVRPDHERYVRVAGQVGFVFKGIVYAVIGGLSCQSAIQGTSTIRGADNSPQGAFILVGNNQFGYPLLIFMALGVFMYAGWRFWEGVTGQGSDDTFGKFKNFFKYRLSPFVSGCVYCAYGAFCCSLIPKIKHLDDAAHSSGFPQSLAGSGGGDFVIAVLGLAFIIATITQLQAAFTRNFHYEMKPDVPVWFSWILIVTGHIGFLGRSGVFLFVGILMFRTIANPNLSSTNETTIGNALSQLQKTHPGRACLFILGFFLIVYGTFAVLNSYGKVFPTQPPSGRSVREARGLGAGPYQPHVDDSQAGRQREPDIEAPADRHKHLGEPAWNHSESRKKLNLEQVDLAVTGGDPHQLDYAARKQERLQAIKELEMKAMVAHQQHSSPRLAPSPSSQTAGSARRNPVAAPLPQEPQLSAAAPALGSETAQRVTVTEGNMEDVSLADSPTVSGTGYGRMA